MSNSNQKTLPSSVKPLNYRITIEPNFGNFTFEGHEAIELDVHKPIEAITLNAVDLSIQNCYLVTDTGSKIQVDQTVFHNENETVTLEFSKNIPAGRVSLHLEFNGEINDKLRGFYRSRYTDLEGEERFLATTQFESTDARRAFPCWDEPSTKATFDVTLVIPNNLVAVSNMPILREQEASTGTKAVQFQQTPVMSTYLVAFIIGDLTCITREGDGGTLIRVWATRGKEKQCQFALDVSVNLLKYFNAYFDIPYPLPKLDHLAIPDFAAGAMENWGAITYRDYALLVDPDNSSLAFRQRVACIIAHEMAHMWFGNLVTMEWWDDLWLNESFASWMGDKAVDVLFPDWEIWTQFISNDTNQGLSLDGLKSSHPIEQPVNNPAEIGELFDAISYSKGASVLRMLEDFIGEESFRQGLHKYLKTYVYGNARTKNLWEALADTSGHPVESIMDTWTKQAGYPTVTIKAVRKRDKTNITFTQKRFRYEDILDHQSNDTSTWQIPIRTNTEFDDDRTPLLLREKSATTSVVTSNSWLKINPGQTGFYRVNYPTNELGRFKAPIKDLVLPPADRLGIQNDAYALARSGYIQTTEFLEIAKAYINETDATVCSDLSTNLGAIDGLLWHQRSHSDFQAMARKLFKPMEERLGWDPSDGEKEMDALLRSTVLSQLSKYGDQDTLKTGKAKFLEYIKNPTSVSPDIRGVVFGIGAKTGEESTYNTIWDLYDTSNSAEEKIRLLMSLGQFRQPELLEETLKRSLSSQVRSQDTISIVHVIARNRFGQNLAWEFLKDNWAEFDKRYGEGGFALMQLVSLTSAFTTTEKLTDVDNFFRENPAPGAERTIRQSLEKIRINIAWLKHNKNQLETWLSHTNQ